MSFKVATACRACSGTDLVRVLELGNQPLANSFLRPEDDGTNELRVPLNLYFCRSCALVQLLDVVDPEILFRDYVYVSGTSDAMREHFAEYARHVVDEQHIGPDGLVVEAASNDGTLLKEFRGLGPRVVGVEPATNIADMANRDGIPTVNEFFTPDVAANIASEHGRADAVVANNVLAHVDDSINFLRAGAQLIKPDGVVVIEAPYVGEMLRGLEWDTIYHEHLCYFSVSALSTLFRNAGLKIIRVDHRWVHGGSIRVWAVQDDDGADSPVVREFREREAADGITSLSRYQQFADDVEANRGAILAALDEYHDNGKRIVGYGAPAKGNTLLNYCGIGTSTLPYTVDRSPLKVGLKTPGMHIPVRDVSVLTEEQPEAVLILAWNFAAEIMAQQANYRSAGGKFLVPVPEPRYVSSS